MQKQEKLRFKTTDEKKYKHYLLKMDPETHLKIKLMAFEKGLLINDLINEILKNEIESYDLIKKFEKDVIGKEYKKDEDDDFSWLDDEDEEEMVDMEHYGMELDPRERPE